MKLSKSEQRAVRRLQAKIETGGFPVVDFLIKEIRLAERRGYKAAWLDAKGYSSYSGFSVPNKQTK